MRTLLIALIVTSSYAIADSDWMNEPMQPFQPIQQPIQVDTWSNPWANQTNSYGTYKTPQGVKTLRCNTHYNPTTGRTTTSCF